LLRLDQAVAASGAFLDGNQRDYFRRYRGGLAFLANAFGLNWGTNVKNPHVDERVDRWHRRLPFPFYYAHRFEADEHAVDVHLADGGQTENTGLWALARRGVRHIVLVDAGFDRSGQLYDLCRVKWDLRQAGLALVLPSLEGFNGRYRDSLCYETLAFAEHGGTGDGKALDPHDRHGYPIHAWRNPVVEGCIVRIEPRQPYPEVPSTTAGTRSPQDVFDEESPQRASCDGPVQSRLYLIKLAIDRAAGPLKAAADACGPVVTGEASPPRARQRCAAALRAGEAGGPPLPAELVGYYAHERVQEEKKEDVAEDGRMRFPQHETVASTFDAYSERYGGYRELGRWYARHLELRRDGGVGSVAAGREHRQPLCRVRASGLLAGDCRSGGANPASGARG
jgi:hypothetical protein